MYCSSAPERLPPNLIGRNSTSEDAGDYGRPGYAISIVFWLATDRNKLNKKTSRRWRARERKWIRCGWCILLSRGWRSRRYEPINHLQEHQCTQYLHGMLQSRRRDAAELRPNFNHSNVLGAIFRTPRARLYQNHNLVLSDFLAVKEEWVLMMDVDSSMYNALWVAG